MRSARESKIEMIHVNGNQLKQKTLTSSLGKLKELKGQYQTAATNHSKSQQSRFDDLYLQTVTVIHQKATARQVMQALSTKPSDENDIFFNLFDLIITEKLKTTEFNSDVLIELLFNRLATITLIVKSYCIDQLPQLWPAIAARLPTYAQISEFLEGLTRFGPAKDAVSESFNNFLADTKNETTAPICKFKILARLQNKIPADDNRLIELLAKIVEKDADFTPDKAKRLLNSGGQQIEAKLQSSGLVKLFDVSTVVIAVFVQDLKQTHPNALRFKQLYYLDQLKFAINHSKGENKTETVFAKPTAVYLEKLTKHVTAYLNVGGTQKELETVLKQVLPKGHEALLKQINEKRNAARVGDLLNMSLQPH